MTMLDGVTFSYSVHVLQMGRNGTGKAFITLKLQCLSLILKHQTWGWGEERIFSCNTAFFNLNYLEFFQALKTVGENTFCLTSS